MPNQRPNTPDPHAPAFIQPHAGTFLQRLFLPLNIAAYITWLVVTMAIVDLPPLRKGDPTEWTGMVCLLAFLALFVTCASAPEYATGRRTLLAVLLQGILVLAAEWCLRGGQTPVLLIIVAAQIVTILPLRLAVAYLIAANTAIAWIWFVNGYPLRTVVLSLTSIVGFQVFAALTGHYAISRERAREHLAQVNAELIATRRLLEESARAGERLKLSRELHDVAGHSLTALKLNLARLARDPALAGREELHISSTLADDLLGQIRQVVGTLRAHDGFDLRAALEALAQPIPGVRIAIDIEDQLRVDDIEQAETLLRCAQEAITNALRHGRAGEIRIALRRIDGTLTFSIENDGIVPARIDFGNGLTGMRERVEAVGGALEIAATPPRGLRVIVRIPITHAPERTA